MIEVDPSGAAAPVPSREPLRIRVARRVGRELVNACHAIATTLEAFYEAACKRAKEIE